MNRKTFEKVSSKRGILNSKLRKERKKTTGKNFLQYGTRGVILRMLMSIDAEIGEVSEWSNVHAWKACVVKATAGSNPVLSAN